MNEIDNEKLNELINKHHRMVDQNDVNDYIIKNKNATEQTEPAFEINYDEFKRTIGEVICVCQIIESDLKVIFACLYYKIYGRRFKYSSNNNMTLGKTIQSVQILESKSRISLFSNDLYECLYRITGERNYIIHNLVKNFCYLDDFIHSQKFQSSYNRIMNFSSQINNIQKTIQNKRIEMCKENDISFNFLDKIING